MTITSPAQLRALLKVDWTFSDEQYAAISAPLGPAVIIAGAGSGKTAVMAARVVWLVANGLVEPGRVLGLTFTNKAAGELRSRVRAALSDADLIDLREVSGEDEEPTIATYHSYAGNLLTEHGLRIGHEPDARLITDAQRFQVASRAIDSYHGTVRLLTDHPATVIKDLLALDAQISEHLVSIEDLIESDAHDRAGFVDQVATYEVELEAGKRVKTKRDAIAKVINVIDRRTELLGLVAHYRAVKAELGLIDFSDQIALVARLAAAHPEVSVSEKGRFDVVLLDEYQDTSVAQALMLNSLFGQGHPVMAVGDPNQAIYGWRGASVSNILEFPEQFAGPTGPGAAYSLATNRRSDRRILEAANHLAQPLYVTSPRVVPLQPSPDAGVGDVRVMVHLTYHDEMRWLADEVIATHQPTPSRPEGLAWRSIAVLVRDNKHAADVFDALTSRDIPVEIVGLTGLLRLPEIAEVVATLRLVCDVTANSDLLTLLAGPRWQIGPRDLALLGRRARELNGSHGHQSFVDLDQQLADAVADSDIWEAATLTDALTSPGDLDYSQDALARFAMLADELKRLRTAINEPVLDIVRRVIDTTGIEIELDSATTTSASARRDNLDAFVQAVSSFVGFDSRTDLPGLLAWLEAEDGASGGLEVATVSESDSVKLLTAHRAKGLEWDVVFVPGVTAKKFPSEQGRSSHLTAPAVLPTRLRGDAKDLPDIGGFSADDLASFKERGRAHERLEELRLGYVAWTRAKHRMWVSAWQFHPGRKDGLPASAYLDSTVEALRVWGGEPDQWLDPPAKSDPNPYADHEDSMPWPIDHHTAEVQRRMVAAAAVQSAGEVVPSQDPTVKRWDQTIAQLIAEALAERADEIQVPLPAAVSATSMARLRDNPAEFAREIARPMPRPPSRAARFGTRFHSWVEQRFDQRGLFDPDDLPGRGDVDITDDADLEALIDAFESGPFADRRPHAVEAPFSLVLAGHVVRGRIDAVYADAEDWLLIDWKTGRQHNADPLQLAIYRTAWAELVGVDPARVRAGFYYVRSGEVVEPESLAGRAELEEAFSQALTATAADRPARLAPIVEADGP